MNLAHRNHQARQLIDLLILEKGVTRQRVMDEIGIAPAVLSVMVKELVESGLVEEVGRSGLHTGRRSYPLSLNAAWGCFLGLEIEAARTLAVCLDASGNELASVEVPALLERDAGQARADGLAALRELQASLPPVHGPLRGIGFADPGTVDVQRNLSLRAVHFPGWTDFDAAGWLARETGLPCQLVASPAARAYAEWLATPLPRPRTLFHMALDDGVGGAYVRGGEPFHGETCSAMEIGHVIVDNTPGAPICHCGNRGCLESVVGRRRLQERVREIERYGVASRLHDHAHFAVDHFVDSVNHSDRSAWAMALEVSESIGIALSAAVTLLNPAVVTFSGRLARLGDLLLAEVRRALHHRSLPQMVDALELRLSTLGDQGTARGAALLSRNACVDRSLHDQLNT